MAIVASQFTERELDIMNVLWVRGSATGSEVQSSLVDELAYNTVLTMLRILEEKGHVRREPEGRAHRYFPLVARQQAKSNAVKRLVDRLFDGEPSLLVSQLVEDKNLTEADLRELRALLNKRLGEASRTAAAPKRASRGRRK
jgi:predicted transcriptional regulator